MDIKLIAFVVLLAGVIADMLDTYYLIRTGKGTEANVLGMKQLIAKFGLLPTLAVTHVGVVIYLTYFYAQIDKVTMTLLAIFYVLVFINNFVAWMRSR